MSRISVIGAGAWGTALAIVSNKAGSSTTLWSRNEEVIEGIKTNNENEIYMSGVKLPDEITVTPDLSEACKSNILIIACGAQNFRDITAQISKYITDDTYVVISSKGIEKDTGLLMSEVAAQTLPGQAIGVLSGPAFAREVAEGLPTALTLATDDLKTSELLARSLGSRNFRVYSSADLIGVQIGGALKNVLAIATGIATGRGLGENARASLITRGVYEIARLAAAKGADHKTIYGLAGLGDISLSCNSPTSRNMSFGLDLGLGQNAKNLLESHPKLVEGFHTSEAVMTMASKLGVELPICEAVYNIINKNADIDDEINKTLSRPMKAELYHLDEGNDETLAG